MSSLLFISVLVACQAHRLAGSLKYVGREPAEKYLPLRLDRSELAYAGHARSKPPKSAKQVSSAAQAFQGKTRLVVGETSHRYDCSGFVMACHDKAGVPLTGSVRMMEAQAKNEGVFFQARSSAKPVPGDVAFFDNSYDRNKNGRRDDKLTHIAVVTSVDAEGTIEMMHLGSKGVVKLWMNLRHPDSYKGPNGQIWNSFLRVNRKGDNGPRLAGELCVGFASLWRIDKSS